jgi:putative transposase
MGTKRRRFSDKFKAKIALEAIRGVKSLAELATEYKRHPNQISKWKKGVLTDAAILFTGKNGILGGSEKIGRGIDVSRNA